MSDRILAATIAENDAQNASAAQYGTGVEADLKTWLERVFRDDKATGPHLFIKDGHNRALPVREWWIGPDGNIHIEVINQ